ncbi:MAG: hypothetical protein COB84_01925 [Rhodobacteraceae bacterium]|nr:MAG: hypothetical protein COB84_01925 [Paracoccaceae bacterium]
MTDETTITDESLLSQATDGATPPASGDAPNPEGSAPPAEGSRHEFVLDKYRAEGRTEDQALAEQAKGYGELQTKFGSFTGSPEAYEVNLSDDIVEKGIEINSEDPLLVRAMEFAKASNMSQEGFNQMVNLHVENQLAEQQALTENKDSEFKGLGSNAQSRIDSVNSFISANFDAETVSAIQGMANSAESITAIEALIAKGRTAPIDGEGAEGDAIGVTADDIKAMQFETDDNGNRRIHTDKAFAAEFRKKQALLYGSDPFRQQIG